MSIFAITPEGYNKLQEEIRKLKKSRVGISKEIEAAREFGDLSENAEYHAAKDKQGLVEANITMLEDKLSRASVIDPAKLSGDSVKFGATVKLQDLDTDVEYVYSIVGDYETNIEKKLVSISSPIGIAMMSKELGDVITVVTPKGERSYEILEIKYIDIKL